MCVQINDAPAVAEANLSDETQHRRLLPGQGDFDLVGLIKVLDEIACSAPIGVEILSDAIYAQPVGGARGVTRRSRCLREDSR